MSRVTHYRIFDLYLNSILIFGTRFNIDKKVIDGILIECVKTLNKYLTKKVRKLFDVDFSLHHFGAMDGGGN
jgi:hypothetical protein